MKQKRNKFDHTHINSTTFKAGYIVPAMLSECLPGDTWQGDTQLFVRVAPLVAPLMHRVNIQTVTVFCPSRLLWNNFEQFITGGPDGADDSTPPFIKIAPAAGTLADYFGLPLCENELKVSALPFRAYALMYNWMFRDQDLQEELPVSLEDGEDTTTSTDLMRGNWAKDYFTTARPWPQKGPGLTIPLVGDGAIVANGAFKLGFNGQYNFENVTSTSGNRKSATFPEDVANSLGFYGTAWDQANTNQSKTKAVNALTSNINAGDVRLLYNGFGYDPLSDPTNSDGYNYGTLAYRNLKYISGLGIDHSSGLGIDVNDLLETMAMQRFQTRRSLFGSRYEDLLHYWGLRTQDFRLQEPELVSVGRGRLQFSEVLQTSPDSSGDGVGAMAGHGVGAMRSGRFRYYCHEHGYLMTVMLIRPQAVYTQGIERMWTRETRWDYWNPEFQHIGQQEVLSREVYADGSEDDLEVFGYQNRYDEYRRGKNHVSGEFRTTMDYWNMARIFENRPSLNSEFITCNPTDRVFQLGEELSDQFYCMVNNQLLAKRLLSRNGNPM